jgi:hypothetical protein
MEDIRKPFSKFVTHYRLYWVDMNEKERSQVVKYMDSPCFKDKAYDIKRTPFLFDVKTNKIKGGLF